MWRWRPVLCAVVAIIAAGAWLPHASAQARVLYFPASGHFLADDAGFLSFWQAHEGERLLGFPISEPQTVDGLTFQYFDCGRLEQAVDPANGVVSVRTGRVGDDYVAALWKSFPPPPNHTPAANERLFAATGHTLRAPFVDFWSTHGGQDIFGAPISEPLWELTADGRRQVQYFARARLERDPGWIGGDGEIVVSALGRALAQLRNIDTNRLANVGVEEYGPPAPSDAHVISLDAPTPAPAPPPSAVPQPVSVAPVASPAAARTAPVELRRGRYIVVNLSDQWLYAFDGAKQVFSAPVSTGRDGMQTPTGTFAVYAKLKIQTMEGVLDGVPWKVPNVPNVMYFSGGVALHGTYWHNRFGTGARLSHGCVNLPLKSAAWLYDWAAVSMPVKVTY